MKRYTVLLYLLWIGIAACPLWAQQQTFRILETTDVHGNYFPYDFIQQKEGEGSMARVMTYVAAQRAAKGQGQVLLLDAGDILQGQPSAYYYNFMDTVSTHVCADIYNYMKYDAICVGNHDVETGHSVYDRWTRQCHAPVLGANVLRTDGSPYWKPYTIIEKKGVKFAILGLLTPGIPNWLPEVLWKGLSFADMAQTAQRYMPEMRAKADVIIGLFHSGVGYAGASGKRLENASLQVAREIPGFDLILCGHDHRIACRKMTNVLGKKVWVLNSGPNATHVAVADLTVKKQQGKWKVSRVRGKIEDVRSLPPYAPFMSHFAPQIKAVKAFTQRKIGTCEATFTTHPAFFGSSAFIDFIHQLQLRISKADISFAAPLSFDATIQKGPIRVADMFNLYRYENMLYTIKLTGKEVKDYLEYSYSHWIKTMQSPEDHLLYFSARNMHSADRWQRLNYPSYNFDSAAGICYEVDVRKPVGERVHIISMANGSPFSMDQTYTVAVNSYRGNGGGGLLTKGAGIPKAELSARLVHSTDKDLRYYMIQTIQSLGKINPQPLHQWKFVPEDWAERAAKKDAKILFQ